ncbi:hypothetical protein TL16_g08067 [Triparma laevis f. inornata]|uniref:Uncharacterized protein n=2 Tax=Triparma laevis TaxID=1534972 RepID=A0A9W7E0A5_9STRA|nr:hypothetical protein TrLO_g9914 [Triparma laevis f. longispina]GMH79205.1 hypothetical protein TL16_g08067 [Triparma laevis f. inornata]
MGTAMSKSISTESNEGHESHKTGVKRGEGDEEKKNEEEIIELTATENSTTLTTVFAVPESVDDFLNSVDFRRMLLDYVPLLSPVLLVLRVLCTEWRELVEVKLDRGFERGTITAHGGADMHYSHDGRSNPIRIIFLQNTFQIGREAFYRATNLIKVDIPEGVESIRMEAFSSCLRLTDITLPTTLTSIGVKAFFNCKMLEKVDLRHTNLQEIRDEAFAYCKELKEMTIPDSLQILGKNVFGKCHQDLVNDWFDIDHVYGRGSSSHDFTDLVIEHLRWWQNNVSGYSSDS